MALHGLRPVAEIQFADFIYPGVDQLVSEAAKYRYRTAGDFHVPMVVRAPCGGAIRGGQYHSQSPEALFIHTPGLKVVCPSNPYDAKGLLIESIRDEDPVVFFEPKRVYRAVKMDVPDEPYGVPLGQAKVVRTGEHVTCVAWGAMLYEILTFLFTWNEFVFALILTATSARTMPVAVQLFMRETGILCGHMTAAAVVMMVPTVILTFFIQRYLVRGLTFGAVK